MKALRLLTLLAVCCATGTAMAAEPAPAKPATPAAKPAANESVAPKGDETSKDEPVQAAKGTQSEEEDAAEEQQAAVKKPPGKGGSPERFTPSEQVRADFDVSFPIDI